MKSELVLTKDEILAVAQGQDVWSAGSMRTTMELIAQLETDAKNHLTCAIAVCFENGTSLLITSKNPDRLWYLDAAVQRGGIPIGLIAYGKANDGHGFTFRYHVYPEHEAVRHQVVTYMERLEADLRLEAAKLRAARKPHRSPRRGGWKDQRDDAQE